MANISEKVLPILVLVGVAVFISQFHYRPTVSTLIRQEKAEWQQQHDQMVAEISKPHSSEIERLTTQIQEFPDDDRLRRARADLYESMNERDKAIADFSVIIDHKKEDVEYALEHRGQLYMRKQQWPIALASLKAAAQYKGYVPAKHAVNEMDMGICQFYLKDFAEAEKYFSAALEAPDLTPKLLSKLHHDRGLCYTKLGKNDLAKKDMDQAKKIGHATDWLPDL